MGGKGSGNFGLNLCGLRSFRNDLANIYHTLNFTKCLGWKKTSYKGFFIYVRGNSDGTGKVLTESGEIMYKCNRNGNQYHNGFYYAAISCIEYILNI